MKKPKIYIVSNLGGGVRKSTTIAHLTFALQDAGQDPIIVSLDVNGTLEALLAHETDVVSWDLNNREDSYEGLQAVVNMSEETNRPAVIDLAALGGETDGIHTLLDTYILEDCDVVSVVPILPSQKSVIEGMKALELIKPQKWFLVQYGVERSKGIYNRMNELADLLKLKPSAIIQPAELTDSQSDLLQRESLPLNEIGKGNDLVGARLRALKVHIRYWDKLKNQYFNALGKLKSKNHVSKTKETSTV